MATESEAAEQALTETQLYWLSHLQRCAQSRQSMVDYARAHNLKITKLYYWSKRLRALGRLPAPSSSITFTPVKLIPPAQSVPRLRVRFTNGAIMEFDGVVQGAALEELLSMLSRLP